MLLTWDNPADRLYQHGTDRGVLYIPGKNPVPWNGIIGVEEDSNTSSSIYYIDGKIYLADVDPGDFTGSLSAYFWPDEFSACIGIPEAADGFYVDNQKPKRFGLSYRSLIGSGTAGDMFGYQIHLIYNAVAQIRQRTRRSINSSSDPSEFQFDITATPVAIPNHRPSSHYIIDTRHLTEATMASLENLLYGEGVTPGVLPDPTDLYDLLNFGSSITFVDHGDGTWTATGAYANVHLLDANTFEILNVSGSDTGGGTYLLHDTP